MTWRSRLLVQGTTRQGLSRAGLLPPQAGDWGGGVPMRWSN